MNAGKEIADFVIGFLRLYGHESNEEAELGGSGTLIQVDDTYGFLTAYHVLGHLPEINDIGLLLMTTNIRLKTDCLIATAQRERYTS